MKLRISDMDNKTASLGLGVTTTQTITPTEERPAAPSFDNNAIRKLRLGDTLIEMGYITDSQLKEALAYQKEHKGERIGSILITLGLVTERQMLGAMAEKLNIEVIDISNTKVDIEAVDLIPEQLANDYVMLPIGLDNDRLQLVVNDPLDLYGIEDIRQTTGKTIDLFISEAEPLKNAIHYYYAEIAAKEAVTVANKNMDDSGVDEMLIDTSDGTDDTPIINLVNSLLDKAYADNVSDIHIEPFEKNTMVRMRIDGAMVEYVTLQKNIHASLIARIKIMGELDIAERRVPQDGHFRVRIRDQIVNVRVSIIPTSFGEKAVLRLLANNSAIDNPGTFGMNAEDYKKVQTMLGSLNGIIYLTGPTGSGKSTTLYMMLAELSNRPVNISTIEDPVEKNLPKLNQMQVHPVAGLTFDVGLRALLRQDPDIIMVGETRDKETASISIRAAITGHLVLSTLHTNDAASSVIRLVDMGIEPYMVSSALDGIIAQRLVRKVCTYCCKEGTLSEEDRQFIGRDIPRVKVACGCPHCNNTGYSGRTAIHEILIVDKELRNMISSGATTEDIKDYAIEKQGMKTLRQSCIDLMEQGITTVEEFRRVASFD
jgi:type IV pilus assembly protein PilB